MTMKKHLDPIIANQNTSDNDDSSRMSSSRQGWSSSTVYENKCIFCQKPNKLLKGQKTRETLIQCRELRADVSIRSAYYCSRDLAAAEGHYNRSCYCSYTREEKAATNVTNERDENEAQCEAALNHSSMNCSSLSGMSF